MPSGSGTAGLVVALRLVSFPCRPTEVSCHRTVYQGVFNCGASYAGRAFLPCYRSQWGGCSATGPTTVLCRSERNGDSASVLATVQNFYRCGSFVGLCQIDYHVSLCVEYCRRVIPCNGLVTVSGYAADVCNSVVASVCVTSVVACGQVASEGVYTCASGRFL